MKINVNFLQKTLRVAEKVPKLDSFSMSDHLEPGMGEPCSIDGCNCNKFAPSPWQKTKCLRCFHNLTNHDVVTPERYRSGTFSIFNRKSTENDVLTSDLPIAASHDSRPSSEKCEVDVGMMIRSRAVHGRPVRAERLSVPNAPTTPPKLPESAHPEQLTHPGKTISRKAPPIPTAETKESARAPSKVTRRAPPPPVPSQRVQSTRIVWHDDEHKVFDIDGDVSSSSYEDEDRNAPRYRMHTTDGLLEHTEEEKLNNGIGGVFRAVARESSRKLFKMTAGVAHRSTGNKVFADLKETGHSMFVGSRDASKGNVRFSAAKQCHQRRQKREYLIDFDSGTLSNLTGKKGQKKWPCTQVSRIDKAYEDPTRLLLCMDHDSSLYARDYDLRFRSAAEREEFYLSVLAAREISREKVTFATFMKQQPSGPQYEQISLFVGSINLGHSAPDGLNWIPPDEYDIYVIGAQECQYPPRTTPVKYLSCEVDWAHTLETQFGPNYQVVSYESLWEMRLMVAVKKEHASKITCVEVSSVATGIANVLGNKGGVGLAMRFNETSLCFINAHLTPHIGNTTQRNENYSDILANLNLGNSGLDANQFDHVVFFGDLNYRLSIEDEMLSQMHIESATTHYHIVDCVRRADWSTLYRHDQLVKEMAKNNAFTGFVETPPQFAPTYRYLRPRPASEPDYYSPERLPAWCDRITWKSNYAAGQLKQLSFKCHNSELWSDHVPITAMFSLKTLKPSYKALFTGPAHRIRFLLSDVKGVGLGVDSAGEDEESSSRHIRPLIDITAPFINSFSNVKPMARSKAGVLCSFADLPPIIPMYVDLAYLSDQYLTVAVYNVVLGSEITKSNLGTGTLPLDTLCSAAVSQSIPFTIQLLKKGIVTGKLSGSIKLDVV